MEFITKNSEETQRLAQRLVEQLIKTLHRGALVLALKGDLGAGKTTFIQGLGKALGLKEKILSPTFVIMKHFNILTHEHFKDLYHIDAYRLANADDLGELGLKEVLRAKKNLVIIEWAERIRKALPKDTLWIEFKHGGEDERRIQISNI